jgi:hypothetical protein
MLSNKYYFVEQTTSKSEKKKKREKFRKREKKKNMLHFALHFISPNWKSVFTPIYVF